MRFRLLAIAVCAIGAVFLFAFVSLSPEPAIAQQCAVRPRPHVAAGEGARAVPVLVYHDLAPERLGLHHRNAMVVPVESFAAQVAWLAREGYYTPTLSELHGFVTGKAALPAKSVVITFDDGYESNYVYAHALLCRHGLRAVLYKIGDRTPGWRPFNPKRRTHLKWAQVREMAESQVWSVENHTYGGHDLLYGRPPLLMWTERQIKEDVARLNRDWAEHGLPAPRSIAYPYGAHHDKAVAALRDAGLELGMTVESGYVEPGQDPLRLPRLPVFPYLTLGEFQKLVSRR